jgi:fructose/tagatose bisphosphate aldolase
MITEYDLQSNDYNPDKLLDEVMDFLKIRNDAKLSKALGIGAPVISKIRSRNCSITPRLLIIMHDATGISLNQLRNFAGIKPYKLNIKTPKSEG